MAMRKPARRQLGPPLPDSSTAHTATPHEQGGNYGCRAAFAARQSVAKRSGRPAMTRMENEMGTHVSSSGPTSGPIYGVPGARTAVRDLTSYWWLWLVVGTAWIVASLVILQFNHASIA